MHITILTFAQARDFLGFATREVPCTPEDTPRSLFLRISGRPVPEHYRVALDYEYTTWDLPVADARELAIIPPVSGG